MMRTKVKNFAEFCEIFDFILMLQMHLCLSNSLDGKKAILKVIEEGMTLMGLPVSCAPSGIQLLIN
jgi:hypothetical protein